MRKTHQLALGVACLVWALVAQADSVEVALEQTARKGTLPGVVITIREPVIDVRLELNRDDGIVSATRFAGKPGTKRRIALPQTEGRHAWKGTLTVRQANRQTASMPLDFETEVYVPARIGINPTKAVDLQKRELNFTLNRPCNRADLTLTDDTGAIAFERTFEFATAKVDNVISLQWPELKHPVLRMVLRAHGVDQTFDTVELTPWEIDIPHEEVNFESGKADLKATELSKLDASLVLIEEGIVKYGRLARLKLFIAGHTDSVGATSANQTLSLRRAQAIALYFRKKKLSLPVLYEGFGEQALLVETDDEVDEPKNRRAEYILTIDTPRPKRSPFVPTWRRL